MHEHAVAFAAEPKRNGLVHVTSFRTLGVCHKNIQFLSGFVQSGGTLSAAIYLFAGSKRKHGIDAARIVAAALYETERRHFYLCAVIIAPCACLREHTTIGIFKHQPPWRRLNLKRAMRRSIHHIVSSARDFPRVVARYRFRDKHHLIALRRQHIRRMHPHTQRTLVHRRHAYAQLRILRLCSGSRATAEADADKCWR